MHPEVNEFKIASWAKILTEICFTNLIFLKIRFDDGASQSSGDSVLIGVEDQKDFQDYKESSQV